jgi:hypothetical protein
MGAVRIVTAEAEGVQQQQAITAALATASQSLRRSTKQSDVAPLPSGDRGGLSSFGFGLWLLPPNVLGGLSLFPLGCGLRLWSRVAAATLFVLSSRKGSGTTHLGSEARVGQGTAGECPGANQRSTRQTRLNNR